MNAETDDTRTQRPPIRTTPRCARVLPLWSLAFAACLGGCMTFESQEERQVRTDRARMHRGEALKYHKDSIELSEHAMEMRVGRSGARPMGGSPPPPGSSYEFRGGPAYEFRNGQTNGQTNGLTKDAAEPARTSFSNDSSAESPFE